jgi:hypothetical protein
MLCDRWQEGGSDIAGVSLRPGNYCSALRAARAIAAASTPKKLRSAARAARKALQ